MNILRTIAASMVALAASCSATNGGPTDGGADAAREVGFVDDMVADGRDAGAMDLPDGDDVAAGCDGRGSMACTPVPMGCGPTEVCYDGLDNNCDHRVDENCPCLPGTVQSCFAGPPGARRIGGCFDGTQRCEGGGEFGSWGACTGGISPGVETCDALDNDCDGCIDEGLCCESELTCPAPGDPRIPTGRPFETLVIDGAGIFPGAATSWHWSITGGPCETVLPTPTFTTASLDAARLEFTPTLSGDYTVTLRVVTAGGTTLECTFVVHVAGEGLRVELCWRPLATSSVSDLDLYLHEPDTTTPWFARAGQIGLAGTVLPNSCNWADCGPVLRDLPRVDWGYAPTALDRCGGAMTAASWAMEGHCPNPRIDIDGHGHDWEPRHGLIENINADVPRDGQRFRILVSDCAGPSTQPVVNVYCGGFLRATLGAAPDTITLPADQLCRSDDAMWRVADVQVHVDASGVTTGCDVTPLRATGGGPDIRSGDLTY